MNRTLIKTTIATFRPRRVFFGQTHNYKTNRATKCTLSVHIQNNKNSQDNFEFIYLFFLNSYLFVICCAFCCSVCFVIVCLPEEDPSGSKRCNGCFDFKVLCFRSLF